MTTAVVAQTKDQAAQLAEELGIDAPVLFGASMERSFAGLRAHRVLVEANADISAHFLEVIRRTVAKMPPRGGIVRRVTVTKA